MGGRWSLVQIQSPRPFFSFFPTQPAFRVLALIGYWTADLAVRLLPRAVADAAARGAAGLMYALDPPARRVLEGNLRRIRPDADPKWIARRSRQAFESFALSLVDFLEMDRLRHSELMTRVEIRGERHLRAALRARRGVIVLSAHLGNWEWGAAFLAGTGPRLHVVARPHGNPGVEAFFRRRRVRRGIAMLPRPASSAAARALRRGEWVALMGDRERSPQGITREVLPARRCDRWVAAMARRTGALVLPAAVVRLASGRYAACFDAPLSAQECARGAAHQCLARWLRSHPGQWSGFEPLPDGFA